jgi:hypothetical protein
VESRPGESSPEASSIPETRRKIDVKTRIAAALVLALAVGACAAYADGHERTVAMWKCKYAEGKTKEDVQAVNAKWLKIANAATDEGEVESYVLTTIVGDTTGFMFVDVFPSDSAWVAMRGAMKTEEGKALDKEFEAVSTCSHNALYESEKTMATK